MRSLFLFYLCLLHSAVQAQKNYSLFTLLNLNAATKWLGTNDSGFGLAIQSNVFTQKKIQLRTEGGFDYLGGEKVLYTNNFGIPYPSSPMIWSFKTGPEFSITNHISLAALYGYAAYKYHLDEVRSGNVKIALTSYLGQKQRGVIGLYFLKVTQKESARFWGISLGYKIL